MQFNLITTRGTLVTRGVGGPSAPFFAIVKMESYISETGTNGKN